MQRVEIQEIDLPCSRAVEPNAWRRPYHFEIVPKIDRDEEIQGIQSPDGFFLVGERDHGVSADAEERPDLALAWRQHFVGQSGTGHFVEDLAEIAGAQARALAEPGSGRYGLRPAGVAGAEEAGVGDPLALAVETTTEHIERDVQMFGEVGPHGHVVPGPGRGDAAGAAGEEPRRFDHEMSGHVGALLATISRL